MTQRILITGSSDGLGSLTARKLISQGHKVVLHGRSPQRASDASRLCPGAETTIVGDLSTFSGIRDIASQINTLGHFDCIVHNAGLFRTPFRKTPEGLPALVAVNSVAPYMLSCLVTPPKRYIFVSSGLHQNGDAGLKDVDWKQRGEAKWNDMQAYSDSKLHNIMLAFAFARKMGVEAHAVDPGWVKTKMGGESAVDDLDLAVETFAMVATGEGGVKESKPEFWRDKKVGSYRQEAKDVERQEKLLEILEGISGVKVPE